MPAQSFASYLCSLLTNNRRITRSRRRQRSKTAATEALEERTLLSGYGPERLQNLWAEDGSPSSNPGGFAESGGLTYFSATTPQTGYELFATDGTEEGTRLVKDIRGGTQSSLPGDITAFEGYVYFTINRGFGRELWYSNGTEFNTNSSMFSGIRTNVSDLNVAGGRLYFTAEHNSFGRELWYIDNPRQAPQLVGDIRQGALDTNFEAFHVFNNQLYFAANGGDLFYANANTYTIYDSVSLTRAYNMIDYNGSLYIDAEGLGGKGLWKSDGQSQALTELIRDIRGSFGNHTNLSGLRVAPNNNGMMFTAFTPATGSELWFSDGTAGNTFMIDIRPGSSGSNPFISGPQADLNGYTYFYAETDAAGSELWRSDGTAAGTIQMADSNPGIIGGMTGFAGRAGNRIIYRGGRGTANDGIWVSDGTQAGTIPMLTTANGFLDNFFVTSSGMTIFQSSLGSVGRELVTSDGTAAGTRVVKDIARNINSSTPRRLTEYNGQLFFSATDSAGRELWATDGTVPAQLLDIHATGSSSPEQLTSALGMLFFSADDGSTGRELWKSDGTSGGTERVADIDSGANGSFPYELTDAGSSLFFVAQTDASGSELFVTDGTEVGTRLVKEIAPGSDSSDPFNLTVLGGDVLFGVYTDADGYELWKSDGTEVGTVPLTNLPSTQEMYEVFGAFAGNVYFSVYDDVAEEVTLWRSDGTPGGTAMFMDVEVGSGDSFIPLGGIVIFGADEKTWATDGTVAGTVELSDRDFSRGVVKDGVAYLVGSDEFGRGTISRTDGTVAGTNELFRLPNNGYAEHIRVVGDEIVYSARGQVSGREVWAFDGNRSSLREITSIGEQNATINEIGSLGTSVFYPLYDFANDSGVELFQIDFAEGPGILVTESLGNTVVDSMQGSDSIRVSLDVAPTSDVWLQLTSEPGVVLSQNTLTFTPANWDQPQRVRLRGPSTQAFDDEGDPTANVTISVVAETSDDAYDNVPDAVVPVTITTIPATNFDSRFTPVDTPTTVPVLENDTPTDELVVVAVDTPDNGTAVINPDGTITYSPTSGFTGNNSFEYQVSLDQTKLSPTNSEMARVGSSIDVSGDYAVVGAPLEDTDGENAGAAYVLKRQGAEWARVARLTGSTTTIGDRFGFAVAIQGERIVVSAPAANEGSASDAGEVFVFELNDDEQWVEVGRLLDPVVKARDLFGSDVSLDGDRIAVGARLDDGQGSNSGSAFVFERNPVDGTWSTPGRIKASDSTAFLQFGVSVSLEGNRLAVGAFKDDVGATDSGAAYVLHRQENGSWTEISKLKDPRPQAGAWFGFDVAIDGDTLVVGSHRQDRNRKADVGAAHVFQLAEGPAWEWEQTLGELRLDGSFGGGPKDNFGYSVDIDGDTILVGTPLDNGGGRNTGSAYAFERGEDEWLPHENLRKIKAADPANYDEFGRSVAIGNADGDFFTLVGAVRNDEAGDNTGAVYANYSRVASATLSVSVGDTLMAASPSNICLNYEFMGAPELEPAVAAAIDAWDSAGASASQLARMREATFRFDELPGQAIGMAAGSVVVLDTDAAGFGWFADPNRGPDPSQIDLATVIAHELGHMIRLDHDLGHDAVMADSLAAGERRMPNGYDLEHLDSVFAESELAVDM